MQNWGKPVDDLARSPYDTLVVLLLQQLVQDGHQPLFELDVVVVGHQEVSNPEQIKCWWYCKGTLLWVCAIEMQKSNKHHRFQWPKVQKHAIFHFGFHTSDYENVGILGNCPKMDDFRREVWFFNLNFWLIFGHRKWWWSLRFEILTLVISGWYVIIKQQQGMLKSDYKEIQKCRLISSFSWANLLIPFSLSCFPGKSNAPR